MENSTAVNFRKEREFGDIFGSTFEFIRQEFKKLGKLILFYVIPWLVLTAILMVIVQKGYMDKLREFTKYDPYSGSMPDFGGFFLYYFLLMLVYLISHTVLVTAIYSYISVYVKKGKDQFEISDVTRVMKKYFFPVFGTFLVSFFLIIAGTIFCVIPGIYLAVSLCLIFIALVFEEKGFSNAFSRTFQLTKLDWWWTFLTLFIVYLIVFALSFILSIPVMAYSFSSIFTKAIQGQNPMDAISTPYLILSSGINIISNLLYLIPYIVIGFQYFSLVEKLEKPSLQDKIMQMGGNE